MLVSCVMCSSRDSLAAGRSLNTQKSGFASATLTSTNKSITQQSDPFTLEQAVCYLRRIAGKVTVPCIALQDHCLLLQPCLMFCLARTSMLPEQQPSSGPCKTPIRPSKFPLHQQGPQR